MTVQKNWAGNYTYQAANWHVPTSVQEVQQLVKKLDKIRVVGSRHSFNSIADSDQNIISLEKFNNVIELDENNRTVTVEGGIRYGDLSRYLYDLGFALPNMASLPHISIAGACATATHGSGDNNQCLSNSIAAMKIVTASGEIVSFSRQEDESLLKGAAVGLGALGVIVEITLDLVPTFDICQHVYENLPFDQLADNFDNIFSSAYSVSLFTNWENNIFNQVWLKSIHHKDNKNEPAREFYGATAAISPSHPIQGVEAVHCTEQLGVPGPWHDRLPHFRLDFTPSNGDELQSEYLVPRELAYEAILAISKHNDKISPLLHVCEIRSIAKDNLWMSPFYQQDSIGIHFTWKDNWESVKEVLPQIEEALISFQARPHWGKLFTMPKERVQSLYEKLPDFQQLLERYDPNGKFRNDFINDYIFNK